MSTDAAHSLSDSFDVKLSNKPTRVAENLEALEVDVTLENEVLWGKIKGYIEKLMAAKSEKNIEIEELLVFPGFEDLLSLLKIKQLHDENNYKVLIVDCAPTGETMALLKFPELFKWWMVKFFPMKKKGAKIARPIVERTLKIPVPDQDTFEEIEMLYKKIEELHELLLNKDEVSLRIVTTPEKIVIQEAKRSFSYLHLYDFNVDAIIINRIINKVGGEGYFNKWMKIQEENIKEIYASFDPVPIFKAELRSNEVRKYEALLAMGEDIFLDNKSEKVLFKDRIFEVEKSKTDESYYFKIKMPFVDKKELNVLQKGDEMSISIKNEKRNFILPRKLHSKEISKANYIDGTLVIQFV